MGSTLLRLLHLSLIFAEAVNDNLVHCGEFIPGEVRYPRFYLGTCGAVVPSNPVIGFIQDIVILLVQNCPAIVQRGWV